MWVSVAVSAPLALCLSVCQTVCLFAFVICISRRHFVTVVIFIALGMFFVHHCERRTRPAKKFFSPSSLAWLPLCVTFVCVCPVLTGCPLYSAKQKFCRWFYWPIFGCVSFFGLFFLLILPLNAGSFCMLPLLLLPLVHWQFIWFSFRLFCFHKFLWLHLWDLKFYCDLNTC